MSETKSIKLNQVLGLEKGIKAKAEKTLTEAHHGLKPEILNGFTKVYKASDENGEARPPETKIVQTTVEAVVKKVQDSMLELFDITAQKDFGNCNAIADIEVDGNVLVKGAPITYILWLGKRLTLLHTFVSELPILSADEAWTYDEQKGLYKTEETFQNSGKKVQKPLELSKATDKHAAQVQLITEDVIVGKLFTTKFSGCIPAVRRAELVARVEKLQAATKLAQEHANMTIAPIKNPGVVLLNFLFSK